jgi:hypothetical protein
MRMTISIAVAAVLGSLGSVAMALSWVLAVGDALCDEPAPMCGPSAPTSHLRHVFNAGAAGVMIAVLLVIVSVVRERRRRHIGSASGPLLEDQRRLR